LGVVLAGAAVLFGCRPAHHATIEPGKVARSIDRCGFASIFTPFLAGPSGNVAFDLDKPAARFFDLAHGAEGGVRHFTAEALDVQAAFRADVEQAIAAPVELREVKSLAGSGIAEAKAGLQESMFESPAEANPTLDESPLVKSVAGSLGVVAGAEEPDLPDYEPTAVETAVVCFWHNLHLTFRGNSRDMSLPWFLVGKDPYIREDRCSLSIRRAHA
jgi:hypothetical protein